MHRTKNHLQLVNAVNQLLNNEELKIKISIKARKTAEKHNFENYINKLENDYLDLIKKLNF